MVDAFKEMFETERQRTNHFHRLRCFMPALTEGVADAFGFVFLEDQLSGAL